MNNSPRAVLRGWAWLGVFALGGYIGSKTYTNYRLKEYTAEGGFGQQPQDTNEDNSGEGKPLRRSVQRTL